MSDHTRWAIKYRPRTLDDMIGQEKAVSLIRGAMKRKAVGNTILVSGATGNGKTTVSRILAAMLSGYKGEDLKANPDLIEYNTGADRSIEHIRKSIAQSAYAPQGGRCRVMLFDEAHALLGPSMSALLKELEEPSPRTKWILCTDQPHKLPAVVLGRSMSIKLENVLPATLAPYLYKILRKEKVLEGKEKEVAKSVASAVYGQPRLGLQILEDVVNSVEGGVSIKESIQSVIQSTPAAAGFDVAQRLITAILSGEELEATKAIASVDNPEGVLIMSNQMLESLIRRKSGSLPNSGIGWATKNLKTEASLHDLLVLQGRFVAALDMASKYSVPPASILYTLARK